MIKAQLSHNPYLMETKVLFNNRAPRINSLVEKYQEGPLHTWIKMIPTIFHDEMNGYDFELEYSGTKLDFEELQKAFEEAKVSDDMVHLFHKNELDDREEKQKLIMELLDWLEANPNELFDRKLFIEENKDLFSGAYSLLLIEQRSLDDSVFHNTDVEVEHISSCQEVESTDLYNTPIVFYISEENRKEFQNDLKALMERNDVIPAQLFFVAHSSVDEEKVKRVVSDLGIENPQFIMNLEDAAIQKYLDIYPRSEYIFQAIKAFRNKADAIEEVLSEKNRISDVKNKAIKAQIKSLDQVIGHLKERLACFVDRDNIDIPSAWTVQQQNLLYAIKGWRNKKTKVSGVSEGERVADEFEKEIQKLYQNYLTELNREVNASKESIFDTFSGWYEAADYGDYFETTTRTLALGMPQITDRPRVKASLLQLKEEIWVQPKEDLLGRFFKSASTEQKEPVLETTYYYQTWRDYAASVIMPASEVVLQDYYVLMQNYEKSLAQLYIQHLSDIITEKIVEKEKVSQNLSEDDQRLENNNNWLSTFIEMLQVIERR